MQVKVIYEEVYIVGIYKWREPAKGNKTVWAEK